MQLSIIESEDWTCVYLDKNIFYQGHTDELYPYLWARLIKNHGKEIETFRWVFISNWTDFFDGVLLKHGRLPMEMTEDVEKLLEYRWEGVDD